MNRRHFFKSTLLGAAAASVGMGVLSIFREGSAWAADSALKIIDMTKKVRKDAANTSAVKVASALNYVDDLKKALKAKKITKSPITRGPKTYAVNDQICEHCMFYAADGKDTGKCQLIPGVLVHGPGSCTSWSPKP